MLPCLKDKDQLLLPATALVLHPTAGCSSCDPGKEIPQAREEW